NCGFIHHQPHHRFPLVRSTPTDHPRDDPRRRHLGPRQMVGPHTTREKEPLAPLKTPLSSPLTTGTKPPPGVRSLVAKKPYANPVTAADNPSPDNGTQPHPGSSPALRSEEHTSELQSRFDLVCRLLLEKKK